MSIPGTNTLLAALTRDAGVSHAALRNRTKPPVGETGDESADAYLAGIFAMICVMEGGAGDRPSRPGSSSEQSRSRRTGSTSFRSRASAE